MLSYTDNQTLAKCFLVTARGNFQNHVVLIHVFVMLINRNITNNHPMITYKDAVNVVTHNLNGLSRVW